MRTRRRSDSPGEKPNAGTCWHAKPGAQIGLGLKPGVTRADFERAIHENRAEAVAELDQCLRGRHDLRAWGQYTRSGRVRSSVETQQQSDTTFRLYDYGRPRELHLKEGCAAIKEKVRTRESAAHALMEAAAEQLVASLVLRRGEIRLKAGNLRSQPDGESSAQILVAIEGLRRRRVRRACDPVTLHKGDAVVVPASFAKFACVRSGIWNSCSAWCLREFPEPETKLVARALDRS